MGQARVVERLWNKVMRLNGCFGFQWND
jgi:hypothetical protein